MGKSKYRIRDFLTAEEVMAALGIFSEKDLAYLKQTPLYRNWEKTGRIEFSSELPEKRSFLEKTCGE